MSRILTRLSMGLPSDPWAPIHISTADQARIDDLVRATIRTRDRTGRRTPPALIQIIGQRGQGKTTAVADAITRSQTHDRHGQPEPLHIIHVQRLYKERVTIADVEIAILTDLPRPSTERIATRGEIRSRQLARCLGQADRTGPIVVVLEETHRYHRSTISALKSLREIKHGVDDRLCGIIMIGQRDTLHGNAEIALRSDTMEMAGLLPTEITAAIEQAIGRTCDPDARAVFAQCADCRNWLNLQDRIDQALGIAQSNGRRAINREDATRVTMAGLRELAQAVGVTQVEIAQHLTTTTGRRVSDSQVSRILSGERTDQEAQSRITDFLLGLQPQSPAAAVGGR